MRCATRRSTAVMKAMAVAATGAALAAAVVALPAGAADGPAAAPAPTSTAADPRRSGYHFMGPATRQLQDDDAQNPAFLWVAGGREAWRAVPPAAPGRQPAQACAGCHGELDTAMRGVAARYPVFDRALGRALGLGQRINQCRATRQGLPAWPAEHDDLLGLEAAIAQASRGLPIAASDDPALEPVRTRGRQLYFTRLGQLNLSCAHCHDERAGLRLGGATIPQAHPTGYPLYRLEWQSIGSLQRRLRGCLSGVRAEPFGPEAAEWVALEAYLKQRAAGMAMDAPAVRP